MKKLIFIISILMFGLVLYGLVSNAQAADSSKNSSSSLDKEQTYNGLYVRTANKVKLSGKVNGDAFLAGQDVEIDGDVSGNIYAAGQNVTVKGNIGGGIHLAGARVEVSGQVGGSVIAAGSLISLTKDAKVGGGIMAAGSSIDIAAPVKSDIYAAGSNVTISNEVGGSVTVSAEQLTLARGATVDGNLTYASSQDATIENDTKIKGSIKRVDPKTISQPSATKRARDTIYMIIAQLLVGLVAIALLPKTSIATTQYINKKPIKSFFGGVGVLFGALIAFVIAIMAIFGLPLAIMIALSFILLVMTATIFIVPFWLGRLVIRTRDDKFGSLALSLFGGIIIVALITLLPVIGVLFGIIMFFTSIGALSLRSYERFDSISKDQREIKTTS